MFRLGRCSECFKRLIPSAQNYEGIRLEPCLLSRINPLLALPVPRTLAQYTGGTSGSIRLNARVSTVKSFDKLIGCYERGNNTIFTCSACDTKFFISRPYSTSRLTHYEVLGLERDASSEDVRAAFLRKSKECHPDINAEDPNNHKQFVLVNEAYSVLSRPLARRDYDLSLSLGRTVRAHSTTDSNHYYHYPRGYYDEEIYSRRDSSGDGDNKDRPYYGIRGIEKVSNSKIVLICIVWMLIGMIVHLIAVTKSSESHTKLLDERDASAHKMWLNAKKSGELYKSERELRRKEDVSLKETD